MKVSGTSVAQDEREILTETRGRVRIVTLNRPKSRNALTPTMAVSYAAALRAADDDPRVRVIVVTGAGAGFCSGADLTVLDQGATGSRGFRPPREDLPDLALRLRKPVIAAVNGAAVGLGFAYMLGSDLRFAAESAKFVTAFSRLGLAAEYGVSWLLPRLIGVQPALDLLLSGRAVSAGEALSMGLVHRVVPDEELLATTVAYAADLADNCAPSSLATIKHQVYGDLDRTRADALSDTLARMDEAFAGPALREAMTARAEKRAPAFDPLPPRRD
ncbi:enoyl-CoA hydratase-related protein [Frankia sp. AgKG'84/4]|uniref:enoyl-CoA hydratase-related protein n=1 Tax=Frankia sp. AgKG'84/4 TaxID=573490 RepID=UPI00200ED3E7|nr:enoyl-CoA hydratase-related protein [Frankia sp. AgKG'84/4]MCL9798336.1 enoyl-CoA hydratase-related protein [Frankia sp. AgKG'84/4]